VGYWREGRFTAAKMSKILEILTDGKWHRIDELGQMIKLDTKRMQKVIDFLERYCFISANRKKKKVILDKTVQKFLVQ
jgi:hypothetical protein